MIERKNVYILKTKGLQLKGKKSTIERKNVYD